MSLFRNIGNAVDKILKPDGTSILPFPSIPGLPIGSARRTTGSEDPGVVMNILDYLSYESDPTKMPMVNFSFLKKPQGGGPPYENVLEQFASYVPLWTLACLTPQQFNDPRTYRGNPSALRNIVFSSAGRFDGQRVNTANGAPEYYVDNFQMDSQLGGTAKTGNTNVTSFTFEVLEPYSMGLFLQSLQVAAVNSGYLTYLNDCPYLLKLEFLGFKDDGSVFAGSELLTKYFTIKITEVGFSVNEGGSKYTVKAAPMHYTGFSDVVSNLPTDILVTGEQVNEVLVSGEQSLCVALNTQQLQMVADEQQQYPDLFEIVFPVDFSDPVGLNPGQNVEVLKSMADPKQKVKQRIPPSSRNVLASNFGDGAIGAASMGFGPESGGNYLFKLDGDVRDESTGRIKRDFMTIDPKQRSFTFTRGQKISSIIEKIVQASKYCVDNIKPENIKDGMVNWYRIDIQIQLLEYDSKRNLRAKKYVYRVVPYKVSVDRIKNPTAATAGENKLQRIIAKRYDYLYSGQNNDIIKFDLNFNGMFFTGALPRPPQNNQNIVNTDVNNAADGKKTAAVVQTGSNPVGVATVNGVPSVKPDSSINTQSNSGDKTVEQMVVDTFNKAFQYSSNDMVNVELEIIGDPYYLSDSGINSNHFTAPGPSDMINSDGSMNWEGSQIFIYITWRNPIEPNLGTTGKGGLFNFPNGGGVTPFSGIYHVTNVMHKFSDGKFTQTLKLARQFGQSLDYVGSQTIDQRNALLYDTTKEEKPKTGPIDDYYDF